MREIKFRWWDCRYKEMIYDIWIDIRHGWVVLADNDAMSETDYKVGELMQFTGLYDKNGREIYEGDIVRCHALTTTKDIVVNDITYLPAQLGWPSIYGPDSYIKVIGNIHESPELLE